MVTFAVVLSIVNTLLLALNIAVVGSHGRTIRRLAGMSSPEEVLRDAFRK